MAKPPDLEDLDFDLYRRFYDQVLKNSKPDVVKMVFVRHGQSTGNKDGKFTGWIDVPLSE